MYKIRANGLLYNPSVLEKLDEILGNLSHPSINRWGLNLFWYSFWYSDRNKSSNVHQDFFFNRLLITFINYGLDHDRDYFYSGYWYNNKSKYLNLRIFLFSKNMPLCYRHIEYKNKVNSELALVKLRIKKKNAHLTKIWILRFQNWIILNIYFIQPLKKKTFSIQITDKKKYERSLLLNNSYYRRTRLTKLSILRLIFFFKYINNKQNFKNLYFF